MEDSSYVREDLESLLSKRVPSTASQKSLKELSNLCSDIGESFFSGNIIADILSHVDVISQGYSNKLFTDNNISSLLNNLSTRWQNQSKNNELAKIVVQNLIEIFNNSDYDTVLSKFLLKYHECNDEISDSTIDNTNAMTIGRTAKKTTSDTLKSHTRELLILYLKYTNRAIDIRSYLVFVKLVLCMKEKESSGDTSIEYPSWSDKFIPAHVYNDFAKEFVPGLREFKTLLKEEEKYSIFTCEPVIRCAHDGAYNLDRLIVHDLHDEDAKMEAEIGYQFGFSSLPDPNQSKPRAPSSRHSSRRDNYTYDCEDDDEDDNDDDEDEDSYCRDPDDEEDDEEDEDENEDEEDENEDEDEDDYRDDEGEDGDCIIAEKSDADADTDTDSNKTPVSGRLSGMTAFKGTGQYYFEVTFRGKPSATTRIGWATAQPAYDVSDTNNSSTFSSHIDVGRTSSSSSRLGNGQKWEFDPFRRALFHQCSREPGTVRAESISDSSDTDTHANIDTNIDADADVDADADADTGANLDVDIDVSASSRLHAYYLMALSGLPKIEIYNVMLQNGEELNVLNGILKYIREDPCEYTNEKINELLSSLPEPHHLSEVRQNGSDHHMLQCSTNNFYEWLPDAIVGCLLDTDAGTINYYVNGVKQERGVNTPAFTEIDIPEQGLSITFHCEYGARLYFNMGQQKFHYFSIACPDQDKGMVHHALDLFECRSPSYTCRSSNDNEDDEDNKDRGGVGDSDLVDSNEKHEVRRKREKNGWMVVDDFPISNFNNPFTLEFQFKLEPSELQANSSYYTLLATDDFHISIGDDFRILIFLTKEKKALSTDRKAIEKSLWYSIAITRQTNEEVESTGKKQEIMRNSWKLYIGKEEVSLSSYIPSDMNSEDYVYNNLCPMQTIYVGSRVSSSEHVDFFCGNISEFRMWTDVRSVNDIWSCLGRKKHLASDNSLLCRWRFTEGQGHEVFSDYSRAAKKIFRGLLNDDVIWTALQLPIIASEVVDEGSNSNIKEDLYSIGDCLSKLSKTLDISLSNFAALHQAAEKDTSVESLFTSIQPNCFRSAVVPELFTFLLIASSLRQVVQLYRSNANTTSVTDIHLLTSIAKLMLNVLKCNFWLVEQRKINPATLGLRLPKTMTTIAISSSKPMLESLIRSVLPFALDLYNESNAILIDTAIETFVSGIPFFFPQLEEKLELLASVIKNLYDDSDDIGIPEGVGDYSLLQDTITALKQLDTKAKYVMLARLSEWMMRGKIFEEIEHCTNDRSEEKNPPPLPGTNVKRGASWRYGSQDGSDSNSGLVVGSTSWRGEEGCAVLVKWDKHNRSQGHAKTNFYRWGCEDTTKSSTCFDLQEVKVRSPLFSDYLNDSIEEKILRICSSCCAYLEQIDDENEGKSSNEDEDEPMTFPSPAQTQEVKNIYNKLVRVLIKPYVDRMKIQVASSDFWRSNNTTYSEETPYDCNWDEGTWGAFNDIESTPSLTGAKDATSTKLTSLVFDEHSCSQDLSIDHEGLELVCSVEDDETGRGWRSCLGSELLDCSPIDTSSAIKTWTVTASNLANPAKCMVGVAIPSFDCRDNTPLCRSDIAWGVCLDHFSWNHSSKSPATVTIEFDAREGILNVVKQSEEEDEKDEVCVVYSGLHGLALVPAFSICGMNAKLEITSSNTKIVETKNWTSFPYYRGSLERSCSNLLVELAIMIIESSIKQLKSISTLAFVLAIMLKFDYAPLTKRDRLIDLLEELISIFAAKINGKEGGKIKREYNKLMCLSCRLLSELTCQNLEYTYLYPDNRLYDYEMEHGMQDEGPTAGMTAGMSMRGDGSYFSWIENGSANKLLSTLFSKGFRQDLNDQQYWFILSLVDGDKRCEKVLDWLAVHDDTHKTVRLMGGAHMIEAARTLFAAIIYHSGYSHWMYDVDKFLNTETGKNKKNENMTVKPHAFLLQAWKSAVDLRVWAKRETETRNISYEMLGRSLVSRLKFLFELEPCFGHVEGESPHEYFAQKANHQAAQQYFMRPKNVEAIRIVSTSIRRLIEEAIPLFEIRALLRSRESVGKLRRDALKTQMNTLLKIKHCGWGIKSSLLANFADTLRLCTQPNTVALATPDCDWVPLSSIELSGCANNVNRSLRGVFEGTFKILADELFDATNNHQWNYALLLLNCWGIFIRDVDHDMVSRVNIFPALHNGLEQAFTIIEDKSEKHKGKLIIRASMKVLFALTQQIASTPSRELMHAPTLRRAMSGPATLNDIVFEILHLQLESILSPLDYSQRQQSIVESKSPQSHFRSQNHLQSSQSQLPLSNEGLVIISEATMLLMCVSEAPSCRRILSRPSWIALFLDMALTCPSAPSRRALRLLGDLLPHSDRLRMNHHDSQLHHCLEKHLTSLTFEGLDGLDTTVGDVSIQIVQLLVNLCADNVLGFVAREAPMEGVDDRNALLAEVTILLQRLLMTQTWSPAVTKILLGILNLRSNQGTSTSSNTGSDHNKALQVAALQVLSGKVIYSLYPGCLVKIERDNDTRSRDDGHPENGLIVDINWDSGSVRVMPDAKEGLEVSEMMLNFDEVHPIHYSSLDADAIPDELCCNTYRMLEDNIKRWSQGMKNSTATTSVTPTASTSTSSQSETKIDLLDDFLCTATFRCVSFLCSTTTKVDQFISFLTNSSECQSIFYTILVVASVNRNNCGASDLPIYEHYILHSHMALSMIKFTKNLIPDDEGGRDENEEMNAGEKSGESENIMNMIRGVEEIPTEPTEVTTAEENASSLYDTLVNQLLEMELPFPRSWCVRALQMTDGDLDEAMNYMLSNGELLESLDRNEEQMMLQMHNLDIGSSTMEEDEQAETPTNNAEMNLHEESNEEAFDAGARFEYEVEEEDDDDDDDDDVDDDVDDEEEDEEEDEDERAEGTNLGQRHAQISISSHLLGQLYTDDSKQVDPSFDYLQGEKQWCNNSDRFFNSTTDCAFSRRKTQKHVTKRRRTRVYKSSSWMTHFLSMSEESVKELISEASRDLLVLYCRCLVNIICVRALKNKESAIISKTFRASKPAVAKFLTCLPLILFRDGSQTMSGFQSLLWEEAINARVEEGYLSLEQCYEIFLDRFLLHNNESKDAETNTIKDVGGAVGLILERIGHDIDIFCQNDISLNTWNDVDHYMRTDETVVVAPNPHMSIWFSKLLIRSRQETTINDLCQLWIKAIQSPRASVKHVACRVLILLVTAIRDGHVDPSVLSGIPFHKIHKLLQNRLLTEYEDYPSFSIFVQDFFNLLSLYELVKGSSTWVEPRCRLPSKAEDDSKYDIDDVDSTKESDKKVTRNVLSFSSRSTIEFEPRRDVHSSCSLELWIHRRKAESRNIGAGIDLTSTINSKTSTLSSGSGSEGGGNGVSESSSPFASPARSQRAIRLSRLARLMEQRPSSSLTKSSSNDREKVSRRKGTSPLLEFEERIDKDEAEFVPEVGRVTPEILMSSSAALIRLRKGGKPIQFGHEVKEESATSDDDITRVHSVPDDVECISISCRGQAERSFDFVVPYDIWLHLAITYDARTNITSLFVNGVLRDHFQYPFQLPMSSVGAPMSSHEGMSFSGELAALRIWNRHRGSLEIQRDMYRSLPNVDGLLASFAFDDSSTSVVNDRVNDSQGYLDPSKLHHCSWKIMSGPKIEDFSPPDILKTDFSPSNDLYGRSRFNCFHEHSRGNIGHCNVEVVDMTGFVECFESEHTLQAYPFIRKEVVRVLLRFSVIDSMSKPIDGMIEFCERHQRLSLLQIECEGKNSHSLKFKCAVDVENVHTGNIQDFKDILSMTLDGKLVDGLLNTKVLITMRTRPCIKMKPGEMTIHQRYLPKSMTYEHTTKTLTQTKSNPNVIEYAQVQLNLGLHDSDPDTEADLTWDPILPTVTSPLAEKIFKSCANPPTCYFVKWIVKSCRGLIHFGFGTLPDAKPGHITSSNPVPTSDTTRISSGLHPRMFSYVSSGRIRVHEELMRSEHSAKKLAVGDEVMLGINESSHTIDFYVNNQHIKTISYLQPLFTAASSTSEVSDAPDVVTNTNDYIDVSSSDSNTDHDHGHEKGREKVNKDEDEDEDVGEKLVPWVFIEKAGDSVILSEVKDGLIQLKYSDDDIRYRSSFTGYVRDGRLHGEGVMHHREKKGDELDLQAGFAGSTVRGFWWNGQQHGLQVSTKIQSSFSETEVSRAEAKMASKEAESSELPKTVEHYHLFDHGTESNAIVNHEEAQPWLSYFKDKKEPAIPQAENPKFSSQETAAASLTPARISSYQEHLEEVSSLLITSKAPFILKILLENGATIRDGIEIDDSSVVGTLSCNTILEAFEKKMTNDGIMRYRIGENDWISEFLRGSSNDPVVEIVRQRFDPSHQYIIVREGGAKVRKDASMESEEIGHCPNGCEIQISERRLLMTEGKEVHRLYISQPDEWKGWVSEKQHLLKKVSSNSEWQRIKWESYKARTIDRRRRLEEQKKVEESINATKQRFQIEGSLTVDVNTPFLLDRSRLMDTGGVGVTISDDCLRVKRCERNSSRSIVVGTRGFTEGVHYWEVNVHNASWGTVFIGVCPEDARSWHGYGMLNYRAVQEFGNERLYGNYFSPGDTIGVLLNMNNGTISFFKDGIEFHTGGTHTVVNMGIAFNHIKSKGPHCRKLFPCLGLRSMGDELSITKSRYVCDESLGREGLLSLMLEASRFTYTFSDFINRNVVNTATATSTAAKIPTTTDDSLVLGDDVVSGLYHSYCTWYKSKTVKVISRPGIVVDVIADNNELQRVLSNIVVAARSGSNSDNRKLKSMSDIQIGSKFSSSKFGEGHLVGVTGRKVWYVLQSLSGETRAWFWDPEEFQEHISSQTIEFKNKNDIRLECQVRSLLSEQDEGLQSPTEFATNMLKFQQQKQNNFLLEKVVNQLNEFADKTDRFPTHLAPMMLDSVIIGDSEENMYNRKKSETISNDDVNYRHVLFTLLRVLNEAVTLILPIIDYNQWGSNKIRTEYNELLEATHFLPHGSEGKVCLMSSLMRSIKTCIFTRVKLTFWNTLVQSTTTHTHPPADEFDRPGEIMDIDLYFPEALNSRNKKSLLSFPERLRASIFGQLLKAFEDVEGTSLRRSYVHISDAGQARAFFVSLTEGVDDHGGPYRAIFQTALGEELNELLDIFVPCDNATEDTAENRDQYILNSDMMNSHPQLPAVLYHFGRMLGVAHRHNILVSLPLTKLFWKPLVHESLTLNDLQAINFSLVNSLEQISSDLLVTGSVIGGGGSGDDNDNETYELLNQVLQRTSIPQKEVENLLKSGKCKMNEIKMLIYHNRLCKDEKALNTIRQGLSSILPIEVFSILTSEEIETLFCGKPTIDLEALKKTTIYEGVSPDAQHIQYFWDAMEILTHAERSQLINFCSGRTRLPSSISDYQMFFKLMEPPLLSGTNPDKFLPTAQTCFFSLSLPEYTSLDIMLSRIRYAINNAELMDADFVVRDAHGWASIE